MFKQLIGGPLLGGLALFVWLSLSWAVLPFHMSQFHAFSDEAAVQEYLRGQSLESGIYMLPHAPDMSGDQAAIEAVDTMAKQGPTVTFMSVQAGGFDPLDPTPYIKGLIFSIVAAFFASLLLLRLAPAPYLRRAGTCTLIGACIALAGPLTSGAFFLFPAQYLAIDVVDHLLGWSLMGLVLAWSTADKPAPTHVLTQKEKNS